MTLAHEPLMAPRRLLRPVQLLWERLPLMDRWLSGELLGPLVFGVAAFTTVSLSVGVVFELVRRVAESGLPVTAAMQVLGLRLPGFLVLSFPMATLMATFAGLQPAVGQQRAHGPAQHRREHHPHGGAGSGSGGADEPAHLRFQ